MFVCAIPVRSGGGMRVYGAYGMEYQCRGDIRDNGCVIMRNGVVSSFCT